LTNFFATNILHNLINFLTYTSMTKNKIKFLKILFFIEVFVDGDSVIFSIIFSDNEKQLTCNLWQEEE
jgi:hypothetical protein